ncbi:hypothetical protein CAEBREN_23794 [Caenorhabditis brenneri]|uniref:Uncharacterized protein n=1 Tax=Caenorhabditis brenneri TaxID=135651 RepID=G0N510_CAEBE|nr:hypothetical protein CAEBREN_23794 [Caenorhabditis brenneri]
MNPPSLLESSVLNVARYLVEGYYKNEKNKLPRELSNEVFRMVNRKRCVLGEEKQKELDETLEQILLPSKMYFIAECEKDISLVGNQRIEELGIEIAFNFGRNVRNDDGPPNKKPRTESQVFSTDIVSLLSNNLTPESQEFLQILDLSSDQLFGARFKNGWADPMSRLLPSLTTLKLESNSIDDDAFMDICLNFPGLMVLDISRTHVMSLTGIEELTGLYDLSIGGMYLEDIDEMYKLPFLKILRMRCRSRESNMMDSLKPFVHSDKTLRSLELFDCSNSGINNQSLRKIEARHPTLTKIFATGNPLTGYVPDNSKVKVILDDTFVACFNALQYYEKVSHQAGTIDILETISDKLEEPVEEFEERWPQNLIRALHQMIPKHEGDRRMARLISSCCSGLVCDEILEVLEDGDKRVLIESFLRIIECHEQNERMSWLWDDMNMVIEITQNPQTDRIYSVALNYFSLTDNEDIKNSCLETLNNLLDKIDLQSDFYKKLDQKKLLIKMKKVLPDISNFGEVIEELIRLFESNNKSP